MSPNERGLILQVVRDSELVIGFKFADSIDKMRIPRHRIPLLILLFIVLSFAKFFQISHIQLFLEHFGAIQV